MVYQLYYWPTVQGRGEFVRLAMEEGGAQYRDVARESGRPLVVRTSLTTIHSSRLCCAP